MVDPHLHFDDEHTPNILFSPFIQQKCEVLFVAFIMFPLRLPFSNERVFMARFRVNRKCIRNVSVFS